MERKNTISAPPSDTGQGRERRSRWLWAFAMTCVMMLGSPEVFGQQQVFDLNAESNKSGSTIWKRWSDWVKTYTSSPNVTCWKGENAWTGWNCWHNNGNLETGDNAGRPTTWWSGSWINPVNNVNYGERCEFWYHFKYENINEITPDHPYIEIWTPCYDNDDSSTSDHVMASALYATNAQGRDVLVAVQQLAYRQLDNYRYIYNSSGSVVKNNNNGNATQMNNWYNSYNGTVSPGILINWSKASENRYFDGSGPERAKLRYYPGWNMGETVDLSFIVNWDMNSDNNHNQTVASLPRYVSKGQTTNSWYNNFYWSVDWPNMYVTKGIKVTNHVNAPTVTRQRNGKLGISASGVTTYSDFVTDFVFNNIGKLELNHNASGSTTMSNIDHKQPISYYSNVHRYFSHKNGSFVLNRGTLNMSGDSYWASIADDVEETVQEFKKAYDVIPGCAYPENVQVVVDKWKQKAVITWDAVKEGRNTNGRFFVYRYDNGDTTPTVVGSVAANEVHRIEDIQLPYNKQYTYTVAFMLDGWDTTTPEPSLSASATADTYRADVFPIALTAVPGETNITLNWNFPAPQTPDGATFKIYRRGINETSWTYLEEIGPVTASRQTDHLSRVDDQIESSCESYYYVVSTELLDTTFSDTLTRHVSLTGDGTQITSLTCNRGTYSNMIKVRWNVNQVGTTPTHFVLYRRLMNEENDAYKNIYECDGTSSSYYYEDVTAQPGQYYMYYVEGTTKCKGTETVMATYSSSEDGFAQSKGVLSGRVSYGTGTAVTGAKVRLTTDGDADKNQFYSLYVDGLGNRIDWADETEVPKVLAAGKAFSVQFWMRPDDKSMENAIVMDLGGGQRLEYHADGKLYAVGSGEAIASSDITLQPKQFYNVTYRYDGNGHVTVAVVNGDEVSSFGYDQTLSMPEKRLTLGAPSGSTAVQQFYGNFDDIRLWSKCLSDEEILGNYQRILSGQEKDLAAYWPVDEGVDVLKKVYDYSKRGGVANEHHAQMVNKVKFSDIIPTEDQLSLYGETDDEGNYVIRGIPYSGDGTNYTVKPVMNSHEFSPQKMTRYVSMDALNHSGVDFTDVSSFEVSGTICYEGTSIPVEGVQISVDGRLQTRNNEIVATDELGKFTVDVPIGRHYISASKDGHTFVQGGRIPVDPTGLNETTYEFIKKESGWRFWDNTLVPVAGRIVGGSIEGDKPLGFGKSTNTIGQAEITLALPEGPDYMLNATYNNENNHFSPASDKNLTYPDGVNHHGTGYLTGGTGTDDAKGVVIRTEPSTGEFAVLLPPLKYRVTSVKMVNTQAHEAYKFNASEIADIDASDPATVLKDSILTDDGFSYFEYVAALKLTKHTSPMLSVRQMLGKSLLPEGVFGDPTAKYKYRGNDGKEKEAEADLYTLDENNIVTYNYNYPIFGSTGDYDFKLKAYETYHNYDDGWDDEDRETIVPLQNTVVTISNALSAEQKVYSAAPETGTNAGKVVELKENQLQLDDKGEAIYSWKAGLPNIQGNYTRTLNMVFDNGDGPQSWQGLEGIIFGSLSNGKNFTTAGPTTVDMVLHDPYGDSSFATWETGYVTTTSKDTLKTDITEEQFATNIHLGPKVEIEEGLILSVQTEIEIKADFSGGYTNTEQHDTIDTHTTTIEVTKAISTSSDPDMVGADADIYIGHSENFVFGGSQIVGLKGDGINPPQIAVEEGVSVSTQFDTQFHYTQYEIENSVIPNLITLRNNLLETHPNPTSVTNTSSNPIYLTTLSKDDEHFGEEGTYTYLKGKDKSCQNMVLYYNESIRNWQERIAESEKYKLDCFDNPELREKKNLSFGGGVEISESMSKSKGITQEITYTHVYMVDFATDLGGTVNAVGVDFAYESHNTNVGNGAETSVEDSTYTATFSYTLADSGADDAFTMDVYKAAGNHSPVFSTKGGQTSCPYEDAELTKYYEPGKELTVATVQIEKPELDCKNRILTGVPAGGKAQFELLLWNKSGIKADAYYELVPVDGANPKGAKLSLPTGDIGNGRTIFVPYGNEPVKMILTLEQGNIDATDYEDIKLALRSTCQNDEASIHGAIKSELSLSAHFVPSSTPVILAIDKTVINDRNKKDDLTLTVTGYDRNFNGLKRIDIQYMAPGATTWSLLQGYIPSENVRTDATQIVIEDGVITLPLNMNSANWTDGTYKFRAHSSATYSGKNVTSESEILTLVKDVKKPQLFGNANPSDGILSSDDEISLTFNEDIQQQLLTENNFEITGVLNGAEVRHDVALSAQNTERAAYSEASINLAMKSFAADMWVKVTSAGDILTHGNGDEKFKVSVDAQDHLVVTVGSESYTSTKTIEKNAWTFLAFNYDYEQGASTLNVRAVNEMANTTEDLFKNTAVADYAGVGSITLGQHFTGSIHELTLWDNARSVADAQAEMHWTKKPSTPHLIGYWKMDEGEGVTIRDYARNRHLTLPNSTSWYLNNDNKAVTLGAQKALKIDISECSTSATEDYAVELWFKGAKADNAAASTLMYAGEESLGLGFSSTGALTMTAKGQDIELSKNDYLDDAWHHLALNVLRTGNATVYVDGKPVKTMSAQTVPTLQGAYLYIGTRGSNQPFTGMVDEIRLWKASMTGELLSSQRTQRLTGKESGLVAYYSFEKLSKDNITNVVSSVGSAKDLCTDVKTAEAVSGSINYVNEAPALKVKPETSIVPFNYVANERSIVITLDEDADRLEGSTLTFTVSGVKDMNGNESNAISWTAYVRRNSLLWKDETEVSVEKKVGEAATFEATFTNESGKSENWTLSGLPTWLTASATSGTLKAQTSKTVTFTIAESVAPGKYETTVYLTGNQNISEPLTLNLKVKSEEPLWSVNKGDYEESMNIIGELRVLNIPSRDEDDIVAAFIDGKCRGLARPEYKSRFDGYFVTMDIYGDGSDNNKTVEFKVFDASTGIIYPVVKTYNYNATQPAAFAFVANTLSGRYTTPLTLAATDEIEQNVELNKGWNWMSLSVKPETFTIPVVFAKAGGKVLSMKGQDVAATYGQGGWISSNSTNMPMTNTDMYAVKTSEALTLSVTGHRVNPQQTPITVKNGWNWVGYYGLQVVDIADALADMDPRDGDIIKGQSGVAYYDGYEWSGSLQTLMPGKGYKIQSATATNRTFSYPTSTVAGARALAPRTSHLAPRSSFFSPVDYSNYAANMVIIAQVVENGMPVVGAELGVFAGDECREAAVTDERGMVYMTVPGDAACTLTFRICDASRLMDNGQWIVDNALTYETDAVVGSPRAPYVIELGTATKIDGVNAGLNGGDIYDLQGRKIDGSRFNIQGSRLQKGVYIVDGQKTVK